MNASAAEGLVQRLLSLPVFRSEWLLWLLLGLSFLSVAVIVERWFYYRGRKDNARKTNVTLAGLRSYHKGLVVLLPDYCPPPQSGGCPTSDAHVRSSR
jgi:hypothetical protein